MDTVAEVTCGTKVVKCILTTFSPWSDMFNSHRLKHQGLLAVNTVATVGLENTTLAVEFPSAILLGVVTAHGFFFSMLNLIVLVSYPRFSSSSTKEGSWV